MKPKISKLYSIVGWLPLGSILLIVIAIYSSWFIAYGQLDRPPQPMMDDPKYIGGFASSFYHVASWCSVCFFGLWILGMVTVLVISILPRTKGRLGWGTKGVVGLAAMVLFLGLFEYAPGGACEWFLD